jgi:hypothetical protein
VANGGLTGVDGARLRQKNLIRGEYGRIEVNQVSPRVEMMLVMIERMKDDGP